MVRGLLGVLVGGSFLAACLCLPAGGQTRGQGAGVAELLRRRSTPAMLLLARQLGITEIDGKLLHLGGGPPGSANAPFFRDVPVGTSPLSENETAVAANPRDKKKLVAGFHRFTVPIRSVVSRSADGGATWSPPVEMPSLDAANSMNVDPALAYAPDGSRVYFVSLDVRGGAGEWDVVVSYSDDDGATWTGPIVVLDGVPGVVEYDKCWIGTHTDASQSRWVYVAATGFDAAGAAHIAFARSGSRGDAGSWSAPVVLDASPGAFVFGVRPEGRRGGEVLVAWYHSGNDGFLSGSFQIRTRRSPNNGGIWGPVVVAAMDGAELPDFLGPGGVYHRWSGAMFPDVEIDSRGRAHIVYTHDPVPGSATAEDGDIRYVTSPGPPYANWSAPVTVNDDGSGKAQGYAALAVGNGDRLHLIWEDHRRSAVDNRYYDIFASQKAPSAGWFPSYRINEAPSISHDLFVGDYIDLAANATTLFGLWTDRRHLTDTASPDGHVVGRRLIGGGGIPVLP